MQAALRSICEPTGPTFDERLRFNRLHWPGQLKFSHTGPERLRRLDARIRHKRPHRRVSAHQGRDHEGRFDPLKSPRFKSIAVPKRVTSSFEVISIPWNAKDDAGLSHNVKCWSISPLPRIKRRVKDRHKLELSCAERYGLAFPFPVLPISGAGSSLQDGVG